MFCKKQKSESMNELYPMPKGTEIKFCPTCERLFYRDEEHQVCNYCVRGLVFENKTDKYGFPIYTYYEGLDQSKQKLYEK